jgi:hypothetical protein
MGLLALPIICLMWCDTALVKAPCCLTSDATAANRPGQWNSHTARDHRLSILGTRAPAIRHAAAVMQALCPLLGSPEGRLAILHQHPGQAWSYPSSLNSELQLPLTANPVVCTAALFVAALCVVTASRQRVHACQSCSSGRSRPHAVHRGSSESLHPGWPTLGPALAAHAAEREAAARRARLKRAALGGGADAFGLPAPPLPLRAAAGVRAAAAAAAARRGVCHWRTSVHVARLPGGAAAPAGQRPVGRTWSSGMLAHPTACSPLTRPRRTTAAAAMPEQPSTPWHPGGQPAVSCRRRLAVRPEHAAWVARGVTASCQLAMHSPHQKPSWAVRSPAFSTSARISCQ